MRLIFIYPIAQNPDQTWHSPLFSIWSAVEVNVAIFCSCAPTLKGLVQRVLPEFLETLGSRYASRGSKGTSGREDSAATAVNSTNSTTSNGSMQKLQDISHVEAQTPQKASGLLGFRRSLFKPFSSATNSSLASCYGGGRKSSDEDIMFEDYNNTRASSRKGSTSPTKMYGDEKGIEVQTVVDQFVEPRLEPKPEAHRTTVGTGASVKDPFDDDQEERDIQRAAWSSK